MTDILEQIKKFHRWGGWGTLVVLALLGLITLLLYDLLYPVGLGPRQPIPFSHRVHVHTKQISCVMCHSQVTRSARAGIPPLQTCLLCHEIIIRTHPYILMLRGLFEQKKPVIWERVNWVPEFVYFNHAMHIRKGVDCGRCHGNVSLMDRVVKAREFQMGFCTRCHREQHASHDCLTCHR